MWVVVPIAIVVLLILFERKTHSAYSGERGYRPHLTRTQSMSSRLNAAGVEDINPIFLAAPSDSPIVAANSDSGTPSEGLFCSDAGAGTISGIDISAAAPCTVAMDTPATMQ